MPVKSAGPNRWMVAILSDVHGNLSALEAVLADIAARGVTEVVVAGDLVGFGANPNEVVDLLITRGVTLVRGNHEHEYVAPYADRQTRARWRADPRLASMCWYLDRLGPERGAFLAALPERHWLDEATAIVHGSPRHIRDAVLAGTDEAELDAMFAGTPATAAFVGHTHRPVIRTTAQRRVVNVGSVGAPLDGDPRAAYVLAERSVAAPPGAWTSTVVRVPYDVERAIAAYDNGLRAADPGFAAVMARLLRAGQDYLGPWLRLRASLPEDELGAALERYLAEIA